MSARKCDICGKAMLVGERNLCRECWDEKAYWDFVDNQAMTKEDGATFHLKPHRTRGRSRY